MFPEIGSDAPWWVAIAMGILTIGLGTLRLYDHFKAKKLEWDSAHHKLLTDQKHSVTEDQIAARKTAAQEAVPVVERLIKEIEEQASEIKELKQDVCNIETRERECSEERRADKVILFILASWAKTQKNPPPIPDDILDRIGAGTHPYSPVEGSRI